jgi:predicted transposase/invertase (TIGR01784 family)
MDTQTKKVFFDKLTYIYLEMPKFNKTEDELETMFDKWLFVLRNLSRLFERPKALQEKVFTKLFEQAEIARFSPEERRGYEDSVKVYRDINNAINTAKKDAKEEGRAEGRKEGLAEGEAKANMDNARKMKAKGFSAEVIADITGLTIEEIETL